MGVITRIVLLCDKGCGHTIEHIDDATRKQTEVNAREAGWSCTGAGHVCPQCVEEAKGVLHTATIRVTYDPPSSGTYPDGSSWRARGCHIYQIFRDGVKHIGGTDHTLDTEVAWKRA